MRNVLFSALLTILTPMATVANVDGRSAIKPSELFRQIESGTAPTIVDVRSRWEFEKGHVPGALHIPFWAAFMRSSEIPTLHQEPVIVYCAHGPRAGFAKAALRLSGFDRVFYLEGHMSGWKKAGLPLE
ncbi:MAG: rhodanese-like domain-containing protein [Gammaproteobacteria bacterium]